MAKRQLGFLGLGSVRVPLHLPVEKLDGYGRWRAVSLTPSRSGARP
jgi:hypothetical protein